jgi:serine/threonine protein phosphatase PrpC
VTGFDSIEFASLTDVGVRRSHNQDSHAILLATDPEKWEQQGHLFLVADGMGAHAVGEKASELAASIIPHTYHKHAHQGAASALRKSFVEANASIHARGQQNREFEGMGTTGTSLLLRPEGAWVSHVGDSRAYRIRDGHIEQLTFDHSLVWVYARQQKIKPEKVQNIPSNVIVRSLGPEPLVQVDVEGPHSVQPGDLFLLCSDGLSGQVTDPEIGAIAGALPPAEACRFLVDLANLRGGPDNITVVIVRVKSVPEGAGVPAQKSGPKKPIWAMIPWPLAALGLGALLAGVAVGMIGAELYSLAGLSFVLAAGAIIAGMIGLVQTYRQQKEEEAREEEAAPAKVYSEAPCKVDRGLLDKLAKAATALRQRAAEKNWDPDLAAFQRHQELGEKLIADNDVSGAFREYCRAMRVLTEAMQRQQNKQEVFQPVWDKT